MVATAGLKQFRRACSTTEARCIHGRRSVCTIVSTTQYKTKQLTVTIKPSADHASNYSQMSHIYIDPWSRLSRLSYAPTAASLVATFSVLSWLSSTSFSCCLMLASGWFLCQLYACVGSSVSDQTMLFQGFQGCSTHSEELITTPEADGRVDGRESVVLGRDDETPPRPDRARHHQCARLRHRD